MSPKSNEFQTRIQGVSAVSTLSIFKKRRTPTHPPVKQRVCSPCCRSWEICHKDRSPKPCVSQGSSTLHWLVGVIEVGDLIW